MGPLNKNVDELTDELNELKLKVAKMNARRNAQMSLLKRNLDRGSYSRNGTYFKPRYLYPSLYHDEPRYCYSYLYPRYRSLDDLLSDKYYEKPSLKKSVAFASDCDSGDLKSNAHSSSMSDLLTKLKDFVFEQERQLTNDLLNKIARSRHTTNSSVLRSSASECNLNNLGNFPASGSFSNPVNKKDIFYKRYNSYARRILQPSSASGYKPWMAPHRSWLLDNDYDWARWYRQYLNYPRYSDYSYHIPKVYPISLPSDVKSIVKSTNQQHSDDSDVIKPSRYKYDPFESDTYIKSRLPSWKQYYYTQKLRSKPSNDSYLQYYDPYYDFFPDAASADSTAELLEDKCPSPAEKDATHLIDDYRDAIYEDIIQNLRTKQQRPASNTFPRRKSARIKRSPSPSSLSERHSGVDKFSFTDDKYKYESPSSFGDEVELRTKNVSQELSDENEIPKLHDYDKEDFQNAVVRQQSCIFGGKEPNPVAVSQDVTKSYNDTHSIRESLPTQKRSSMRESSVDNGRQTELNETIGSENQAIVSSSSDLLPDSRSFLHNARIQQSVPQRQPSIERITKAESIPVKNYPVRDQNNSKVLPGDRGSRPYLTRRDGDHPSTNQNYLHSQPSLILPRDSTNYLESCPSLIRRDSTTYLDSRPSLIRRDSAKYLESRPSLIRRDSANYLESRPSLIRRDSTRIQHPQRKPNIDTVTRAVNQFTTDQNYSQALPRNNGSRPSIVQRDSTRIQQIPSQHTTSFDATLKSESTPSTNQYYLDTLPRDSGTRPPLIRRDSTRNPQALPQKQSSIDTIAKADESTLSTNHPTSDQDYAPEAYISTFPPVSDRARKSSTGLAHLQRRRSSQFTTVEKDSSLDPTEEMIHSSERQPRRDSLQIDSNQRVTPSLDRRDSIRLIPSTDAGRRANWSNIARSDTLNKEVDNSNQLPPDEHQLVHQHQTSADYVRETEGRDEVYNNTDFSQPIYEQYDEGNNADFYYNNNNNYQPSRYEADSEYVGDNVTPNANYEGNPQNLVYNSYEQPYYENEYSNNEILSAAPYNSNVTSEDGPRIQNYDELYQNGTNYLIEEDPDDYKAYNSNSTGVDDGVRGYAQNTFPTEYAVDGNGGLLEEGKIEQIEPIEYVTQMNEEQIIVKAVESEPSKIPKDVRELSETSQSIELNASAPSTNSFQGRKKSTENEIRSREPISRRSSKITLNSTSDENKKSRTQLLGNDSQRRVSRPKPGENNKLKRTASTVNKSKAPVSRRS